MKWLEPGERFFSLSDLALLLRRQKRFLKKTALLSGALMALYCLLKAPQYVATATFKERIEKTGADSMLKGMLSSGSSLGSQPEAETILKSNQILKPLVARLGLQARMPEGSWLLAKALGRMRDNVCAEWGSPLSDAERVVFADVYYEGETPTALTLQILDEERFMVRRGASLVEAKRGERVEMGDISFRLLQAPSSLKRGRAVPLIFSPWTDVVSRLRGQINLVPQKKNNAFLDISVSQRNRFQAAEIANELMQEYRTYLKRDHDDIANDQLSYLEQRQKLLCQKYDDILTAHYGQIEQNMNQGGFLSATKEADTLLREYYEIYHQDFLSEIELDRLFSWDLEAPLSGAAFQEIYRKIRELVAAKDLIDSTLFFRAKEDKLIEPARLDEVRCDLRAVTAALHSLEQTGELPLELELFHDPDRIVQSFAHHVAAERQQPADLALYLRNLSRLFSVRENILVHRSFQQMPGDESLEGIDLKSARRLIEDTTHHLGQSKAAIEHYEQFARHLHEPTFELSALSTVLKDPVSLRILTRATELQFKLKDEKNYSAKEEDRLVEELALSRHILRDHLQQMIELETLNISLFQDKIARLQQVCLDCINREMSVCKEQILDLVHERKETLKRERALLAGKMGELKTKLLQLPNRWRSEAMLEFEKHMNMQMMQSITTMVESKTIGQNLHHIESKPLDFASVPYLPVKPRLLFFSLFAALLGTCVAAFSLFLKGLQQGFPATARSLTALGYPFSGALSSSLDGLRAEPIGDDDLDTLRKIQFQIGSARFVGLFCHAGPDYSHALAALLARAKRKVLLIRCDFSPKFSGKDLPGLLQTLESNAPPRLCAEGGYHVVPHGGYTRFATELFRTPAFAALLAAFKTYDHVLLFSRAPVASAAHAALRMHCEETFVTVGQESIEMLTPLAKWGYDGARCRLTFLTTS